MSNISVDYDVLNQKQTPAFYASSLATRPAFGYPGRIFIDTDSPSSGIYRDTGSAWVQVADPGAGTTGTLQQVTTNGNTTTLPIQVQGIDISKGTGTGFENIGIGLASLQFNTTGEYNTSIGTSTLTNNRTGISNTAIGNISLFTNVGGNYNTGVGGYSLTGSLNASNNTAIGYDSMRLTTSGSNNTALGYQSGRAITTGSNNTILGNYIGTATLTSNIVLSDGVGNVRLFADANGLIAINQAVGSVPGGQIDIHTAQTYALVLNGLTTNNAYTAFSNNNVGKWRIGNTYNAGANTFDVYNLGTSSNAISINSTTNNVLVNSTTDDTVNKFQVNGSGIFSGKLKVETTSANSPQFFVRDTTNTGYGVTSYLQNSAKTLYIGFGDQNYASFSDKITITSAGVTSILNLAGTGSRAVLADANGVLSAPVSDISVKQNIQTIGYGLNEIIKMNPVWFDYIDEYKSMGDKRQNGNIAQEMKAIIPEAVFTTPSTGKMGINYDQLHAVYIKAIQELKAEIDALKNN
jgi:hypothetical protein